MAIDWDAEVLDPVMAVFGEGDPASPGTWPLFLPRSGNPFRLSHAVFDAEYLDAETTPGDDTGQTSRRPVLGVRTALFTAQGLWPRQNDRVTIPSTGKTYLVRDVQPDGHGHAKLMLMETAA